MNVQIVGTVENGPLITKTIFGANAYFAPIDGNPLPNAPKYNLNFAGRYDIPVTDGGKLFVATDWNVQGYTSYVLYKTKEFTSNGNFEGGAKIGYSASHYEVALFVRNLTNEKNLKGVIENYMAAVYNEPRIFGISVSGKFCSGLAIEKGSAASVAGPHYQAAIRVWLAMKARARRWASTTSRALISIAISARADGARSSPVIAARLNHLCASTRSERPHATPRS